MIEALAKELHRIYDENHESVTAPCDFAVTAEGKPMLMSMWRDKNGDIEITLTHCGVSTSGWRFADPPESTRTDADFFMALAAKNSEDAREVLDGWERLHNL